MNRRSIPQAIRCWLHSELEIWRAGGILSDDQSGRILALYETPAEAARHRSSAAIFALCGVAALMIGLAVLLLVSYNWQEMPPVVKLTILFGSLVGSFAAAAGLRYAKQWRLTSEIVLLLTGILYGANIWLIAQIFNIQAHYPNGFLFWAIGLLPFVLCLDTPLLHVLYAVLLASWVGAEILGFPAFRPLFFHRGPMIPNGAYALPLLVLPGMIWAYRKQSAATVAIYAPLLAWWAVLQPIAWHSDGESVLFVVGITGALLLLAAAAHRSGNALSVPYWEWGVFVTGCALIPPSYADVIIQLIRCRDATTFLGIAPPLLSAAVGVLGAATILAVLMLQRRREANSEPASGLSPAAVRLLGMPAVLLLLFVGLHFWVGLVAVPESLSPSYGGGDLALWTAPVLVPVLVLNAMMVVFAVWLMRRGLRTDSGRLFAIGVLYFLLWSLLRYTDLFSDVGGMPGAALMFLFCGLGLFVCARFWHRRKESAAVEETDVRPIAASAAANRLPTRFDRFLAGMKRWEVLLLGAGLLLQLTVLVGMIAGRAAILQSGDTVLLRVVPIDPRDLFRGDYVTLGYDFSRVPDDGIPGLGKLDYANDKDWQGRTVFVELLPEADGKHYRAGAIGLAPPAQGKFLRGTIDSWRRIDCGIEAYYVQEGDGKEYEEAARNRKLSAEVALTADGQAALRSLHIDDVQGAAPAAPSQPKPSWPSDSIYRACYLPDADIALTGRAEGSIWANANIERQFTFPWKDTIAPRTEFQAFCTKKYLYFAFRVEDPDIVVLDTLKDKADIVQEDRVEVLFSTGQELANYFCFEIDPKGRVYDYSAHFYRKFDPKWSCPDLETKAVSIPNGYSVEGRIPLVRLVAMGFPELKPGVKICWGLYRAEFSHVPAASQPSPPKPTDDSQAETPTPGQDWISWVAPKTPTPDFHLPGSFGWLEIVAQKH